MDQYSEDYEDKIDKSAKLVVIDWDDTIFPTSYFERSKFHELERDHLHRDDQKDLNKLDALAIILLDHALDMGDVLILFEDFDKAEEMGMKFVPGAWAKIVDEMKDLWMEKSDYRNAADWKTRALMHRVETLGEKSTDSKLRVAFYSKEEWCTSYDRMKKVFQDTRTKFNVTAQTPGIAETAHALKAGSTSLTKFVEDNKPKPF